MDTPSSQSPPPAHVPRNTVTFFSAKAAGMLDSWQPISPLEDWWATQQAGPGGLSSPT